MDEQAKMVLMFGEMGCAHGELHEAQRAFAHVFVNEGDPTDYRTSVAALINERLLQVLRTWDDLLVGVTQAMGAVKDRDSDRVSGLSLTVDGEIRSRH